MDQSDSATHQKILKANGLSRMIERELHKNESVFRLLVDAVKDYAIFALDVDGNIRTWNAGAQRLKGYTADEVIGTHFSRFYTQADIQRNHPKYELRVATEIGRYEEEGWRVRKDGSLFWANVVISKLMDSSGNHIGFTKVTRDLTEKKHYEEELRSSEERMRLMIQSVKDYAIFMLDQYGHVSSWNEGAERIKGYKAPEILGKHFSIFYPQEDRDGGKPAMELEAAMETGRFEDYGWRLRKDGSQFWANVVITAIKDSKGKLIGFTKVIKDLTAQKLAEAELMKAYQTLEMKVEERTQELSKAVVARDEFLSIASHELKTPLTSLKLQIQMRKRRILKGDPELLRPDELVKAISDDEKQINRIHRLVDDMLDISRLSSGKLSLYTEEFDLSDVLIEVARRFEPQAEEIGSSFHLDLSEGLFGYWDRYRIEQVIANLLTNAIKYGNRKPITITSAMEGERAQFTVSDQGIGISKEDQDRIFMQFERARDLSGISGLGLGLYIVKQILDLHGGEITVESEPGKGSQFKVSLPLEKKDE